MENTTTRFMLVTQGKDRHGFGCDCGLCNANGHSYEVAIFRANITPDMTEDEIADLPLILEAEAKEYGPTVEAALDAAETYVKKATRGRYVKLSNIEFVVLPEGKWMLVYPQDPPDDDLMQVKIVDNLMTVLDAELDYLEESGVNLDRMKVYNPVCGLFYVHQVKPLIHHALRMHHLAIPEEWDDSDVRKWLDAIQDAGYVDLKRLMEDEYLKCDVCQYEAIEEDGDTATANESVARIVNRIYAMYDEIMRGVVS